MIVAPLITYIIQNILTNLKRVTVFYPLLERSEQ